MVLAARIPLRFQRMVTEQGRRHDMPYQICTRLVHKHVPLPTWSLASLRLNSDAPEVEPLTAEQLSSLSKRAMIHIPDDEASRKDLANMMQLIQQVVDWNKKNEGIGGGDDDAALLYDLPRGVKEAPLRSDDDVLTEGHPAVSLEKTVSIGGHKYFATKTR